MVFGQSTDCCILKYRSDRPLSAEVDGLEALSSELPLRDFTHEMTTEMKKLIDVWTANVHEPIYHKQFFKRV